jgi:hypothetical protein
MHAVRVTIDRSYGGTRDGRPPDCAGTQRGDASDDELFGVTLLTLPADPVTGDSYLRLGLEVNVSCHGLKQSGYTVVG